MTPDWLVSASDITAARRRITDHIVRTPLVPSATLSREAGARMLLKLESVQPTGSFKLRGAASRILALDRPGAGVVTASTGNHGRAVAHIARELDVPATVCVSKHVPEGKRAALTDLGCDLRVAGDSQADALREARALAEQAGMALVHPFQDPAVIAGQGTIGLELLEDEQGLEAVVVPVSGGGLASGIAVALKAARPDIRVVGVSMERGATMAQSLEAGHPLELPEERSLADSLQGGVGQATFALVRELVDEIVRVDEQAIWDGMRFAFDEHRLVLEGAAAVGIGAILAGQVDLTGPTAIVCTGANAEESQLQALAAGVETPPG
ncbi:MAG: pyridoxal-phosphate dependent enzyme [Nitriliruptorales bacterium]|nr:pyridoxal-phosphate dependent enzyme [Nitriliruptorales bacterium]